MNETQRWDEFLSVTKHDYSFVSSLYIQKVSASSCRSSLCVHCAPRALMVRRLSRAIEALIVSFVSRSHNCSLASGSPPRAAPERRASCLALLLIRKESCSKFPVSLVITSTSKSGIFTAIRRVMKAAAARPWARRWLQMVSLMILICGA